MRCPSCLILFEESAEVCPNCQFTLAPLDKKFGTVPKMFRYLTDFASYFTKKEQETLEKKIAKLERNFPGLHLSIVTVEVHHRFKPREYLFWLMNRCYFTPMDSPMEKSFSIVLFFDSASRSVFLTTGYGLHSALPEEKLEAILEVALPYYQRENFYTGTVSLLQVIKRHLRKYCSNGRTDTTAVKDAPKNQLKPAEELF